LEKGKMADMVILETDLLKAPESSLLEACVVKTYLGGELVYEAKKK